MPLSALGLALAAALVHALWNVLIARAREPEAATAVALVASVVAFAPAAAADWDVQRSAWPYITGSSALELVYFALLAAAYRRSELSLVYPLARGLAPVLVLAAGVAVLGTGTSAAQAAGVCLVGVGVLLVRGLRRTADPAGAALGLAIASCIAAYTLVDDVGVEHASPLAYLELVMVGPALVYAAAVTAVRGRAALRAEVGPASLVAGVSTFGAYALVLVALDLARAAPVAAVRETSVLIATAMAAAFLGERVGLERALGAAAIVAGVALLGA